MENSSEALRQIEERVGLPQRLLNASPFVAYSNRPIGHIPEFEQRRVIDVVVEELTRAEVQRRDPGSAVPEAMLRARDRLLADDTLSYSTKAFIEDFCFCS